MIYCNPTPIAASAELDKDVTESILNSFSRAVLDLAELGKNLEITVGPCNIKINNRHLSYTYNQNFTNQLNNT